MVEIRTWDNQPYAVYFQVICIKPVGIHLNGRAAGLEDVDRHLAVVAKKNRKSDVIVVGSGKLPCGRLVSMLDLCLKHRLQNLSLLEDGRLPLSTNVINAADLPPPVKEGAEISVIEL